MTTITRPRNRSMESRRTRLLGLTTGAILLCSVGDAWRTGWIAAFALVPGRSENGCGVVGMSSFLRKCEHSPGRGLVLVDIIVHYSALQGVFQAHRTSLTRKEKNNMRKSITLCEILGLLGLSFSVAYSQNKGGAKVPDILNFKMKGIDGKEVDLSQYKGKVVMFVNVASQCGYTPQYKWLQALYEKYQDQGMVIIGVPANEFGKQEPGTDAEIAEFCSAKYNVKFPMLSKVVVKRSEEHTSELH